MPSSSVYPLVGCALEAKVIVGNIRVILELLVSILGLTQTLLLGFIGFILG